jgi:hypothetical protein
VAVAAALLALAVAPALDRSQPWFDYEHWADDTATQRVTTFDWNHSYSRLRWPRDGRELLRISSPQRAYW